MKNNLDNISKEIFESFKTNSDEAEWTKKYLSHKGDFRPMNTDPINEEEFDNALKKNSYETFKANVVDKISREDLYFLSCMYKIKSLPLLESSIISKDCEKATQDLKDILGDEKYPGVCFVKTPHNTINIGVEGEELSKRFGTNSVSKVFTGFVILEMIHRGIIPEGELNKKGVELDDNIKSMLPKSVQEHLSKVTLLEAMTHKANLPDFLENYIKAIEETKDVLPLEKPEDFLKYSEEMKYDDKGKIKTNKYSNIGILIAALASQYYYNKDKTESEKKPYNDILKEILLEPAGLEHFSFEPPPPENKLFNGGNPVQHKIWGGPAGGYWTSTLDMIKFAEYISDKVKDEKFKNILEKYGTEFYNSEKQSIEHRGELSPGDKTSTWFSLHIPSKTYCIMASNSDYSGFIGQQISKVIIDEGKKEELSKDLKLICEKLKDKIIENKQNDCDSSNSLVEKLHLGDHHQDQKSFVEQIKDQEHNNKNNDKQH